MKLVFDHRENTAEHIYTFWFKPMLPVQYTAGQFTELHLPHQQPDDRGIKRWFTLSSAPSQPLLSITTKFSPKGSSFKKALLPLQPGTTLHAADPMGDFVLPKNSSTPLVFVAGGIGITPFHSMVQWLQDTDEKRSIHLLYAANTLEEVAFRPLFTGYGLKFDIILDKPPANWKGLTGGLTPERLLQIVGPPKDRLIYLSGPEPMVEALQDGLMQQGVSKSQLVGDFFPGYTAI